jgi:DNA-binding HxlR family transcriptional regulator
VPLLQGVLADREAWSSVGQCSIEKTMSVLGTKSAMLTMREAYYGTTRFDDFAQRVGITKAAASARLSELVDLGLLTRRPYREPGQRTREEYVPTDCGLPISIAAPTRRSRSAAPKAIRCRSTNSAWNWPDAAGATIPEPASLDLFVD